MRVSALVGLAWGCIEPVRDSSTVLFASGADLQSINPLVAVHPLAKQVQKFVLFRTLAAHDEQLNAVPSLARWEWSSNRDTLTLRLDPDVTWHDGVPTRAADVVWTLRTAMDRRTAYPRASDLAAIAGVTATDSLTVQLRFARPQPLFPDVLTDLAILPAHRFADTAPEAIRSHPFNLEPVGNGPFRFVEYRPNQRWVFQRVGPVPDSLSRVERLVIVIVDESTTKLAALTAGELDFAGINPAHADFVRGDPSLDVVDYPVQFAVALVWNLRRPPFDDVRVRRALTAALNRQQIVDAYVYGFGSVADGPVSPGHHWYEETVPVTFDPEWAGFVLDSLGWKRGPDGWRQLGGETFEFEILAVSSGGNALEQMAQAQLADIGVRAHLRVMELSSFLAVAQGVDREYDALVVGVPGNLSLGHVSAMYASDGGPLAYPGYVNHAFDAELTAARAAATSEAVDAAWRRAQRILAQDHPTTWLYHARGVQGISRRMQNVRMDLRGELATVSLWSPQLRVTR